MSIARAVILPRISGSFEWWGLSMASNDNQEGGGSGSDFSKQAEVPRQGIVAEFVDYLRQNKKWWLTPIIVVLLLVGLLIVLGGTAAAPFIYTLF
jgi:hypothetical protein